MNRRSFLSATALSAAAAAGARVSAAEPEKPRFLFSVKSGMINDPSCKSWEDKCRLLKDLGFDGVEMDSQYAVPVKEAVAVIEKTGLPIHGIVNANHWSIRLSDPSADIRAKALQQLIDGLRYARAVGCGTLLLVPGAVRDKANENKDHVWQRSIEGIRRAVPVAAETGVRIGIETVWNGFLYDPEGGPDQKPDVFLKYLDEINNAWVGAYLDLGNFRKYCNIPNWLRALGPRVIKCDAKDFRVAGEGKKEGFVLLGDGDVDWPDTRKALAEINYYGWISSEIGGGDRNALADNLQRLRKCLLAA